MATGIRVQGVGHVVLKVSDVERSLGFYRDALGLVEVARMPLGERTMVFLSTGSNHHDIALLEVGADARRPDGSDIGLFHVALKIGDDLATLRDAKAHLEACGSTSRCSPTTPSASRSTCTIPTATRSSCSSMATPPSGTRTRRSSHRSRH